MQAAITPMLAVSQGRQIDMSSPNGRRGYFFENWDHGEGIERIKIIGRQCPRISAEFLDQQRKKLRFFADEAAKKWPLRGSLKRMAAFL
jgi:hypothetical protein